MNVKLVRAAILFIVSVIALSGCGLLPPPTPQIVVVTATPPPPTQAPPTAAARTVTVLVGSGKDQNQLAAFFPPTIRIRAGDTVNFKLNSDDPHTVTFPGPNPPPNLVIPAPASAAPAPSGPSPSPSGTPGTPGPATFPPSVASPSPSGTPGTPSAATPAPSGPPALIVNPDIANEVKPTGAYDGKSYVNSGILNRIADMVPDAPLKDSWSLSFARPGVYQFMDMLHPFQQGLVEVVDASAADVPPPDAIAGQAQGMIGAFTKLQENAKQAAAKGASEPGANNTTIYFVQAGFVDLQTGNPATEVMDFAPKQVTIKAGDSVQWTSQGFHVVTFNPKPPDPKWETAKKQGDKTFYFLNFDVFGPSKPSGTFDATKFFNSGPIGPGNDRAGWLLTFDKPGTYDYFCAIHKPLGMKGTIIVQAK